MTTQLETTIPFAGFYNSIHDSEIDSAFTSLFDYNGDGEMDFTTEQDNEFWTDYNPFDWGIMDAYCQDYTDFVAGLLEVPLKFKIMVSPREYNFATDRIFVEIDPKDVLKLYEKTDKNILRKLIKETFTSRSGFSSYYSNSLDDWEMKLLKDWDANEIGTLIEACLISAGEYDEMEYNFLCESNTYELVMNKIPDDIHNKYHDYMVKNNPDYEC